MSKNFLPLAAAAALLLAASCSRRESYTGAVRELVPQEVAGFRLAGEPKPVPIAERGDAAGALRPVEALSADYRSESRGALNLGVFNYSSAEDADTARERMRENFQNSIKGAALAEGDRPGRQGRPAGRKLTVEDAARGLHQAVWKERSFLYVLTGASREAVAEFESGFPF